MFDEQPKPSTGSGMKENASKQAKIWWGEKGGTLVTEWPSGWIPLKNTRQTTQMSCLELLCFGVSIEKTTLASNASVRFHSCTCSHPVSLSFENYFSFPNCACRFEIQFETQSALGSINTTAQNGFSTIQPVFAVHLHSDAQLLWCSVQQHWPDAAGYASFEKVVLIDWNEIIFLRFFRFDELDAYRSSIRRSRLWHHETARKCPLQKKFLHVSPNGCSKYWTSGRLLVQFAKKSTSGSNHLQTYSVLLIRFGLIRNSNDRIN